MRLQQLADRVNEQNREAARRLEQVKDNIRHLLELMRLGICNENCRLLAGSASARRFDVVARARVRIPAGQSARVRTRSRSPRAASFGATGGCP